MLGAPDNTVFVQVVSKVSPLLVRHRGALFELLGEAMREQTTLSEDLLSDGTSKG